MTKKVLGRGLEALIPRKQETLGQLLPESGADRILELPVDEISPNPYQPRKKFNQEKLEELSASIRQKGIVQPVVVRQVEGKYQLIAGERRLQAVKKLGMTRIPAIVKRVGDREMLEMSLIENLQRDDLNPIEEANSCQQLIEKFGLTQEELAERLGKDRSSVANTVRLLKLPREAQNELLNGEISRGHGIALLAIKSTGDQLKLCRKIVRKSLSVRQTEVLVTRALTQGAAKKEQAFALPEFLDLQEKLQRLLGTRVNIRRSRKGGRIEVHYYSDEDLNRILSLLGLGG